MAIRRRHYYLVVTIRGSLLEQLLLSVYARCWSKFVKVALLKSTCSQFKSAFIIFFMSSVATATTLMNEYKKFDFVDFFRNF